MDGEDNEVKFDEAARTAHKSDVAPEDADEKQFSHFRPKIAIEGVVGDSTDLQIQKRDTAASRTLVNSQHKCTNSDSLTRGIKAS